MSSTPIFSVKPNANDQIGTYLYFANSQAPNAPSTCGSANWIEGGTSCQTIPTSSDQMRMMTCNQSTNNCQSFQGNNSNSSSTLSFYTGTSDPTHIQNNTISTPLYAKAGVSGFYVTLPSSKNGVDDSNYHEFVNNNYFKYSSTPVNLLPIDSSQNADGISSFLSSVSDKKYVFKYSLQKNNLSGCFAGDLLGGQNNQGQAGICYQPPPQNCPTFSSKFGTSKNTYKSAAGDGVDGAVWDRENAGNIDCLYSVDRFDNKTTLEAIKNSDRTQYDEKVMPAFCFAASTGCSNSTPCYRINGTETFQEGGNVSDYCQGWLSDIKNKCGESRKDSCGIISSNIKKLVTGTDADCYSSFKESGCVTPSGFVNKWHLAIGITLLIIGLVILIVAVALMNRKPTRVVGEKKDSGVSAKSSSVPDSSVYIAQTASPIGKGNS